MLTRPLMFRGAVAAVATPRWNTADKEPSWTLSNGDRTASATDAATARAGVRGLPSKSAGTVGFRVVANNSATTYVGVANSIQQLNALGENFTAIRFSDGTVITGGNPSDELGPISAGANVDVVVNFTNRTVRFYVNASQFGGAYSIPAGDLFPFAQQGGSPGNISIVISGNPSTGSPWI